MKHKIEIAPNLAIYIDGERVIGSKPHGLFLTTVMTVSDDDLKRLADRCFEVISDRKDESFDNDINVRSKDEPQYDFGEYADRLWKIAYERGKREALEQTEPSCDTCKLKGTTEWCKRQEVCRAYKPKDEPQLVKESVEVAKDLVKAFCEDGTWLERQGVYTLTLAEAKQRAVDIIESVMAKDEPQTVLEAVLERQTDEDRRKLEESIRKAIKDEQSGKE